MIPQFKIDHINPDKCYTVSQGEDSSQFTLDMCKIPGNWMYKMAGLFENLNDRKSFIFRLTKSNYTHKQQLIDSLQVIYVVLFDSFKNKDHPPIRLSDDAKASIRLNLNDGVSLSSEGFHDRINICLEGLFVPKNLDEILGLIRRGIVEHQANLDQDALSNIHLYNQYFTVASSTGFGVKSINKNDGYYDKSRDEVIQKSLKLAFEENYIPLSILLACEEQIRNVLLLKGYTGKNSEGYEYIVYSKCIDFLSKILEGELQYANYLIYDNDKISDLSWLNIRQKLWAKLNEEEYFWGFSEEQKESFLSFFASELKKNIQFLISGEKSKLNAASKALCMLIEKAADDQLAEILTCLQEGDSYDQNGYFFLSLAIFRISKQGSEAQVNAASKVLVLLIEKASKEQLSEILAGLQEGNFNGENGYYLLSLAIAWISERGSEAQINAASKALCMLIEKAADDQLAEILAGLQERDSYDQNGYLLLSVAIAWISERGSEAQINAVSKVLVLLIEKASEEQLSEILAGLQEGNSHGMNGYFLLSLAISKISEQGSATQINAASKVLVLLIEKASEEQLAEIFAGWQEGNSNGMNGYFFLSLAIAKIPEQGSEAQINAASKVLVLLIEKASEEQLAEILTGLQEGNSNGKNGYFFLSLAIAKISEQVSATQINAASKVLVLLIEKASEEQLAEIIAGLQKRDFYGRTSFYLLGKAITEITYDEGSEAKINAATKLLGLVIEKASEYNYFEIISGLNLIGPSYNSCSIRKEVKYSSVRLLLAKVLISNGERDLSKSEIYSFSFCKKEIIEQIKLKYDSNPNEAKHYLDKNHPVSKVLKFNRSNLSGIFKLYKYYDELKEFVNTSDSLCQRIS